MFLKGVIFVVLVNWTLICVVSLNVSTTESYQVKDENITLSSNEVKAVKLNDAFTGRGHLRKQKKFLQLIYPLVISIIAAKSVVIPLILKLLTVISSSSFIMSKVALFASGLVLLNWIVGFSGAKEKTKVEIIQLPQKKYNGWNDRDTTYSNIPINNGFYNAFDIADVKDNEFA